MKTCYTYIVAFFLTIASLLPILVPVYFTIQHQRLSHKMDSELNHAQLHTLTLNPNEVQWVKPGKELRIGNRFFDVKQFTIFGNYVIIKGLFDDGEAQFRAELARCTQKEDNTSCNATVAFILSLQYNDTATIYRFNPFFLTASAYSQCWQSYQLSKGFLQLPPVPPNV